MPAVRAFAVFMSVLSLACISNATVIYQWIDDSGHTQMSDVVPEKYKATAKRVDSRQFEISPETRIAAQAQAAALKASSNETSVAKQLSPIYPASAAVAGRRRSPADLASCPAWWRTFVESRDCFGSYQTNHGPLRPGAYEECGPEVPNPEPTCGPEERR
jgi:hypothetical protein